MSDFSLLAFMAVCQFGKFRLGFGLGLLNSVAFYKGWIVPDEFWAWALGFGLRCLPAFFINAYRDPWYLHAQQFCAHAQFYFSRARAQRARDHPSGYDHENLCFFFTVKVRGNHGLFTFEKMKSVFFFFVDRGFLKYRGLCITLP